MIAPSEQKVVVVKNTTKPGTVATAFDGIRADYEMSRETRFNRRRTGLPNRGGNADYHQRIESDFYNNIEKCRDVDRNDMIVGQVTTRAVENIVQQGFTLDPTTGDQGLDNELFARWQEFADSCDVAGESTWHDFETHACRSMLVDGDCAILGTDSGHLQFIEAHSIQTKTQKQEVVLGVEKDELGRRSAYYVMSDPIEPYKQGTKGDETKIPTFAGDVRQVFHVYSNKRITQTRGTSAYAPIFIPSGMFDDINFANLVRQQIASCFAIFRKKIKSGSTLPTKNQSYGYPTTETTPSGTRYIDQIAPGMEIVGEDGEELQGFSPDIPGDGYFQQARLLLQIIGVNLGVPLCLVLMDGSETNFSGWRGAVDEARKGWRSNQMTLVKRLHKPAYRFKVSQWIDEDPAIASVARLSGVDVFGHIWRTPKWQYIQPEIEVKAAAEEMQSAQASPSDIVGRRGQDWQELADRIVSDWAYAIRAAKKTAAAINGEFNDGAQVHWRELLNITMPQGIQMTMQDPALLAAQKEAANAQPA